MSNFHDPMALLGFLDMLVVEDEDEIKERIVEDHYQSLFFESRTLRRALVVRRLEASLLAQTMLQDPEVGGPVANIQGLCLFQ